MSDALSELRKIIERNMVVCYNKRFDIVFLEREYKKYGIESPFSKITDALVLARKRIMDIDNYKLSCLADYFKISYKEQHRAMSDCEVLYRVFLKLNEIWESQLQKCPNYGIFLVFPTQVGMIPSRFTNNNSKTRFPHTSGDDPQKWDVLNADVKFSPHKWGWSSRFLISASTFLVFPTQVGMILVKLGI